MSFPGLIDREAGARFRDQFKSTLDRLTEDHLLRDSFQSQTFPLSPDFSHTPTRCGNFVAVWRREPDQKTLKLSLWSLFLRHKLWNIDIALDPEATLTKCKLSERGMVLATASSQVTIIHEGKITGSIANHSWRSIIPLGLQILGCFEEKSDYFFSEWDMNGELLRRIQLDPSLGNCQPIHTCAQNFWVRLGGVNLGTQIEVIDRITGDLKTFVLPISQKGEAPLSAYIVANTLYFAKSVAETIGFNHITHKHPHICQVNLDEGKIIQTVPVGGEEDEGEPKHLVANSHFVAWVECKKSLESCVKFLEPYSKNIKEATTVPHCSECPDVYLDLHDKILSVTYAKGSKSNGSALWQREVVDMEKGIVVQKVNYQRTPWGECSMSQGHLLVATPSHLYVESFEEEGPPRRGAPFRVKEN